MCVQTEAHTVAVRAPETIVIAVKETSLSIDTRERVRLTSLSPHYLRRRKSLRRHTHTHTHTARRQRGARRLDARRRNVTREIEPRRCRREFSLLQTCMYSGTRCPRRPRAPRDPRLLLASGGQEDSTSRSGNANNLADCAI